MRKAIFIDKDGTLIVDVPFNVDTNRVKLVEGAADAIAKWKASNYLVIVITNQSGVARGYFQASAIDHVMSYINTLLQRAGTNIDAFYYCPHHPEGTVSEYVCTCSCRKPAPGLILGAAEEWNIDLKQSWMIGDILHDVEAGNRSGCRTILIHNGNETEWNLSPNRVPSAMVHSLMEAAELTCQAQYHYD